VTSATRLTTYGNNSGLRTPMRGYRSRQPEYFVQNDWRVKPNVTLNLGLRYSYYGVFREVNNALSIFSPSIRQVTSCPIHQGGTRRRVDRVDRD
jgi:outer membrane receptor protein involved in Fe transport